MKDYSYFMELYAFMDEVIHNELVMRACQTGGKDPEYRRGLDFVRWEVGLSIDRCYRKGLDRFDFDPIEVYTREIGYAKDSIKDEAEDIVRDMAIIRMYERLIEMFFKTHK